MFNRILTWTKINSDNLYAKSKVIFSNNSKMTHQRFKRDSHDDKNDRANSLGDYHILSDDDKAEMDKVREILDEADRDNL